MKVLVLGAGVIGAAMAASVAGRGHDVHVLEAGPFPAAGTSGTTYAWVNANNKHPQHYHRLNAAAIDEHHRADGVARGWLVPTGHVEYATTDDHRQRLTDRVERLAGQGYPASFVDSTAAAELEPDLRVDPDALIGWFPTEAHCYPELFISAMLGTPGITVETNTTAAAAEDGTVRLANGETRTADRVVICLGRHTTSLCPQVRMIEAVRGNKVVGVIARTAPTPVRLSRLVTTDTVNLRPAGGGALLAHALDQDPLVAPDEPVPAQVVATLRARIHERVGYPVTIASAAVGLRALPADGLPVVGPVDARAYVVVTHSAVTLAPLLGELVATELCTGAEQDQLAPYRPERLATS